MLIWLLSFSFNEDTSNESDDARESKAYDCCFSRIDSDILTEKMDVLLAVYCSLFVQRVDHMHKK